MLGALLATGLLVGLAAWFVIGSLRDSPDRLDDATVRTEVTQACRELRTSLGGITVAGLRDDHRAAIVEQNAALGAMIDRLRGSTPTCGRVIVRSTVGSTGGRRSWPRASSTREPWARRRPSASCRRPLPTAVR